MSPPESAIEPEVDTGASPVVRQLEAVLEPVATTLGHEVVLVEWLGGGGGARRVLRVYLDHPGGVSLDDCARMSRIFSNALEAAEGVDPVLGNMLRGSYHLEVSSPGLERPLTRRSHFDRFLGQRAKVRTTAPLVPETRQRSFGGVIDETTPDPERPDDDRAGTVTLREPDGGQMHRIPISAIRRAYLVYEG